MDGRLEQLFRDPCEFCPLEAHENMIGGNCTRPARDASDGMIEPREDGAMRLGMTMMPSQHLGIQTAAIRSVLQKSVELYPAVSCVPYLLSGCPSDKLRAVIITSISDAISGVR
jgi:hypothetical protein